MTRNYGFQKFEEEKMAKAMSSFSPISTKVSKEIATTLRYMYIQKAKQILEQTITLKTALPYYRHTNGVGHKTGMSSGRYPTKASAAFLNLLKSAEANAQAKGLNAGSLKIVHIAANKAPMRQHMGRQGGRLMKRTHIEVVVAEGEGTAKNSTKGDSRQEKKRGMKEAAMKEVAEESTTGEKTSESNRESMKEPTQKTPKVQK